MANGVDLTQTKLTLSVAGRMTEISEMEKSSRTLARANSRYNRFIRENRTYLFGLFTKQSFQKKKLSAFM